MSKLGKFLGHAQEVEIEGERFEIYPLKVKYLKSFMGKENATQEEQMEMSKEIIKNSFKNPKLDDRNIVLTDEERKKLEDEIPTDDEIENIKTETFMKLMDAINKLNGFKDEKIDRIRQLKKQSIQGE